MSTPTPLVLSLANENLNNNIILFMPRSGLLIPMICQYFPALPLKSLAVDYYPVQIVASGFNFIFFLIFTVCECENNGQCVDDGVCQCAPGWSGDKCQTGECHYHTTHVEAIP